MDTQKTIYLHIGKPKTGTSALQYFLLKNRNILRQNGIEYPVHKLDPNHISSGNAELIAKLAKDEMPTVQAILSEIIKTPCPSILLSSEFFYLCDHLENIKQLFNGFNVQIIIYWRRQDRQVMSLYNQHVKRRLVTCHIDDWVKNKPEKRFSNEQLLKWTEVFGKENIHLRVYEQQQFVGKTIFSDFLNVLNLSVTDDYEFSQKKINPSYRIDALESQRLFNFLPLGSYRFSVDTLLQDYSSGTDAPDWPYNLLSPAKQLEIIEQYADMNAAIARDYLGREDGRLFNDPLPDPHADWQPYPGLSNTDIQRIASFISKQNPKIAYRIGRAIRKGLQSNEEDIRNAARTLAGGLDVFLSRHKTLKDHFDYFKHRLFESHA